MSSCQVFKFLVLHLGRVLETNYPQIQSLLAFGGVSQVAVSNAFDGFAARESAEAEGVLRDETLHPLGVSLGVFAQSPSDGFPDEELAVIEVGFDGEGKEVKVQVVLETDLGNYRGPPFPHVGIS